MAILEIVEIEVNGVLGAGQGHLDSTNPLHLLKAALLCAAEGHSPMETVSTGPAPGRALYSHSHPSNALDSEDWSLSSGWRRPRNWFILPGPDTGSVCPEETLEQGPCRRGIDRREGTRDAGTVDLVRWWGSLEGTG